MSPVIYYIMLLDSDLHSTTAPSEVSYSDQLRENVTSRYILSVILNAKIILSRHYNFY